MSDDEPIDQTIEALTDLADRTAAGRREPNGDTFIWVEGSELEALRSATTYLREYAAKRKVGGS